VQILIAGSFSQNLTEILQGCDDLDIEWPYPIGPVVCGSLALHEDRIYI
jgi:hypothetical protein